MKLTFRMRGKAVALASLDDIVALRPSPDVRRAASPGRLMKRFRTAPARDDARDGRIGLELAASNRKLFEQAGWMFVEAREPLVAAAQSRAGARDAAVRPVFVDRGGNTLVGTELVTVQLPPDMGETETRAQLRAAGLTVVRQLRFAPNLFEVRLAPGPPFPEALARVQAHTAFVFAEPAFLQSLPGRMKPTDPGYRFQWQHANDGSNGGRAGADIRSEKAWDVTLGAGVRIAVIDNGMQASHPDLAPGLVGGGHFASDGSGTATFVPRTGRRGRFPAGDHGTFCLGMAGARMNNRRGGCGSAPEAELIPIACLTDQVGTQTTLARAVAYAADPGTEDGSATAADGAHAIACSLGPNGATWDLTSVLDLALQHAARTGRAGRGVPILWAVSNGPFEVALDEVSSHPEVIAVGRSNRSDLEDGSAFGPELEFLAPGREVYSTQQGGRYGFDTGTSYACPLAAGVAALVLARHPGWTRDEVRAKLRASCDKIGGVAYDAEGRHPDYGYGRINAERAVT